MKTEVVRTRVSLAEFFDVVDKVTPGLTDDAKCVLWAHVALETASGEKCWNWNLGNIKWFQGWQGTYIALKGVFEYYGEERINLTVEDTGSRFLAFPTLDDGVGYYTKFLRNRRYASCWTYVVAGDPIGFAKQLRKCGYYTAPEKHYVAGIVRLYDSAKFVVGDAPTTSSTPQEEVCVEDYTTWPIVVTSEGEFAVRPTYIAPVSISKAISLVAQHSCEIPTMSLVDAIWTTADKTVTPRPMRPAKWDQAHMASPEMVAKHNDLVLAEIGGAPFRLLAGSHKDICRHRDGRVGVYGWHKKDGRILQPFFSGHSRDWVDYSQGVRLVRRVA